MNKLPWWCGWCSSNQTRNNIVECWGDKMKSLCCVFQVRFFIQILSPLLTWPVMGRDQTFGSLNGKWTVKIYKQELFFKYFSLATLGQKIGNLLTLNISQNSVLWKIANSFQNFCTLHKKIWEPLIVNISQNRVWWKIPNNHFHMKNRKQRFSHEKSQTTIFIWKIANNDFLNF